MSQNNFNSLLVPVDLLTSTSTSSPAEYGTTGVGKFDKYGCSINGKYFSEGSKVPSTPNKPCEHCYCIRNMTTCVMQECTLHVDGCTPIYHKDVCCPVRYSCGKDFFFHFKKYQLFSHEKILLLIHYYIFRSRRRRNPSIRRYDHDCTPNTRVLTYNYNGHACNANNPRLYS